MPRANWRELPANLSVSPCTATQQAAVGQEESQMVEELVSKRIIQVKGSRNNTYT